MAIHFNGLTPAEAERLALLSEEAGEIVQAVGKILRHGYGSRHPNGGPTNRELLEKEIGDLKAAVTMMVIGGDVGEWPIIDHECSKLDRVKQYLHHQER